MNFIVGIFPMQLRDLIVNGLLIVVVILSVKSSLAQHTLFGDTSSVWSVYIPDTGWGPPKGQTSKYYIAGDSMINSKHYKIVHYTTDSVITSGLLYAFVREDSTGKMVYGLKPGAQQEKLLYDFSLEKGDTTTLYPLSFIDSPGKYSSFIASIKVLSIDSVLIGGIYRKRWEIGKRDIHTPALKEYWIEGIGSTRGILGGGAAGIRIVDGPYPSLMCYENNQGKLFQNPKYSGCYLLQTSLEERQQQEVVIYPNPVKSTLEIKTEKVGEQTIVLRDYTGKVLLQKIFNRQVTIDVNQYAKGVYFIQLVNDEKVVQLEKVVKM